MGLLDKILKEGADAIKDIASEENKKKAQDLFGSLKESLEEHKDDLKKAADELKNEFEKETGVSVSDAMQSIKDEASSSSCDSSVYEDYEDGMTARQRILGILADKFPKYDVKENVSPATIGGTGRFMNYSIAVYDGNVPKLFIMLIGKTTTAHREYRWSRQEAEKRGYSFINFVEHFPNRPEYIEERLRKYLG
jgi:uncharacterized protein YjbJ (UPF0337 family)